MTHLTLLCRTLVVIFAFAACGGTDSVDVQPPRPTDSLAELKFLNAGLVTDRFTAELWVSGTTAYTTTWGTRTANGVQSRGNAVKVWDITGTPFSLADSIIVSGATTLGDVQVTDDGRYMVVAVEAVGSIVIYDLANPRKPVEISRFTSPEIQNGVHTAEVQSVNGKLYAFLSVDPRGTDPARLVIVDISNPAAPATAFSRAMGTPFVHDVFVRDGILMTALWNDGISIFDIGGGGKGGTISAPVQLGAIRTVGGQAHNIFWYRDPVTGSRRYAFVGQEGNGSIGVSSTGDIHVVDVSDMANPREVAFYTVAGAGAHNFSADEQRGILYAAYYNGGVRALNIRGDLGTCTAAQKAVDGRCDLGKMGRELARGPLSGLGFPVYVWGVHFTNGELYASDMLNGLLKLSVVPAS